MFEVTSTTNKISWFFRPIAFKENNGFEPTKEGIQDWFTSQVKKPNIIQRSSPATISGIVGIGIGVISFLIGKLKDSTVGKWFGWLLSLGGVAVGGLGIFKYLDLGLKTKETDIPTLRTIKKGEILKQVKVAMESEAQIMSKELEINPEVLKACLPKVITLDEALKAALSSEKLRADFKNIPTESLRNFPTQILRNLPDDLLRERFPEGLPDTSTPLLSNVLLGGYSARKHDIGVDEEITSQTHKRPEEIGHHEGLHAIESILRSKLTKEELKEAICSQLVDEIINGTPFPLTALGRNVEIPYIPDKELRIKVANFLKDIISNLDNQDSKLKTYKPNPDVNFELTSLRNSGLEELKKFVNLAQYKDFLELFDFDEERALLKLTDLITNQLFRFNLAMGKYNEEFGLNVCMTIPEEKLRDLPIANLELSSKARQYAIQSAKDYLLTMEGNLKIQRKGRGIFNMPSEEEQLCYHFCPEEIRTHIAGTNGYTEGDGLTQYERKRAQAEKEVYKLGEKLLDVRKRISIAPQDKIVIKRINKVDTASGKIEKIEEEISRCLNELEEEIRQEGGDYVDYFNTFFASRKEIEEQIPNAMINVANGVLLSDLTLSILLSRRHDNRLRIIEDVKRFLPSKRAQAEELENLLKEELKLLYDETKDALAEIDEKAHDSINRLIVTDGNRELIRELIEIETKIKAAREEALILELSESCFDSVSEEVKQRFGLTA